MLGYIRYVTIIDNKNVHSLFTEMTHNSQHRYTRFHFLAQMEWQFAVTQATTGLCVFSGYVEEIL